MMNISHNSEKPMAMYPERVVLEYKEGRAQQFAHTVVLFVPRNIDKENISNRLAAIAT